MLILAMDANFRLKNRMRVNDRTDPELGPGWAYFVGNKAYKKHLKNYVSEEDVSWALDAFPIWVLTSLDIRSAPVSFSQR
jgi:Kyakuja-Dileera-Zisupton transposase